MEVNPESYFLSWGGFQRNIKSSFADLAADKNFTDVTLACEGEKQIAAHKVVLSASSPFFRQILIKNPHQNPLIYLKGVGLIHLRYIIEFIYFGEVKMKESDLQSFIKLSEELEVKGLSELFIQPEVPVYSTEDGDKTDLQKNDNELELNTDIEADLDRAVFIDDKDDLSETAFKNHLDGIFKTIEQMPKEPKQSVSSSGSSGRENLLQSSITNEDTKTIDQIDTKSTKMKRRSISMSLFSRSRSKERRQKKEKQTSKQNTKDNKDHPSPYASVEQLEDKAEISYQCNDCEERFKFEVGLFHHKETVHDSVAYQCVNCNTKCRSKENLHRHMELKDHY